MKVVILAGGSGTRISEESRLKPKPMIEIGERPILWHIMKLFSHYNFNEFIVCAGYKQHLIKEYFANYFYHTSDITFDFTGGKNQVIVCNRHAEPWKVSVVDTGENTMTGGRLKRISEYLGTEPFMLTYGDGVSDINIAELLRFHRLHGRMVTLSACLANQRFGLLNLNGEGRVLNFREKPIEEKEWINIGFMVCEAALLDLIEGDDTVLEDYPLVTLAKQGQLMAFCHSGFWQCMDTLKEKNKLQKLWETGQAPWRVWSD